MIRSVFAATALLVASVGLSANAQQGAQRPNIQIQSGFQAQNLQVRALGEHNVADSATLRARGCQGFVASDPSLSVVYNDQGAGGAVVIRAESPTDLVLLIGTSTGAWFCNNDAVGTNPEITLPPGSGSYSVWVGTAQRGNANANVTIREVSGARPAQVTGRCGSPTARIPMSMASEDWTQFTCMGQEAAGTRWASCVGRATYSDFPRDGCPGAELCCPAEGFDIAASQQRARTQASGTGGTTSASSTAQPARPATPATPATPPSQPATQPAQPATQPARPATPSTPAVQPSQAAAQSQGGSSLVEANPYGARPGALTVYWRGFENAKLPVHAEPNGSSTRAFELDASQFPVVIRDSVIAVTTPRRLRAKSAQTLASASGNISVAAGQEIELLALAGEGTCHVSHNAEVKVAACPSSQNFDGVTETFFGLSASDFEWWVAVESPSRQRGWLRIDARRPEFIVVIPPR